MIARCETLHQRRLRGCMSVRGEFIFEEPMARGSLFEICFILRNNRQLTILLFTVLFRLADHSCATSRIKYAQHWS